MTLPFSSPEIRRLLEHQGFVQRLARQLCLDESSAQDLEQETWLAALKYPPSTEESPKAWLRTVMRNLHFKRYRRTRNRGQREAESLTSSCREVLPPEEELAAQQARERMGQALARLPEDYRAPVILRFEEGLPPREIGVRLGIETEQARWRVRRGVEILRSDLALDTDRSDWLMGLGILAGWPMSRSKEPLRALAPAILACALAAAILVLLVTKRPGFTALRQLDTPDWSADALVEELETPPIREVATPAGGPSEAPEASLARSEFVSVRGCVLSKPGEPLPNAALYVLQDDAATAELVGYSNALGEFVLDGQVRGAWLFAGRLKRRSDQVRLDGPALQEEINLRMITKVESFEGTVFGPDGDPAEGVVVSECHERASRRLCDRGMIWRSGAARPAVSDSNGRFVLQTVPLAAAGLITARGDSGSWEGSRRQGRVIRLGDQRVAPRLTRIVFGSVAPENGEGLLFVRQDQGANGLIPIAIREDGSFRAELPCMSGWLVRWTSGKHRPLLRVLGAEEAGDLGRLTPQATGSLELVVNGPEGPIEDFVITLRRPGEPVIRGLPAGKTRRTTGFTDFLSHDLSVGEWDLLVMRFGHVSKRLAVNIEPGETTRVELSLEYGIPILIRMSAPTPPKATEFVRLVLMDEAGDALYQERLDWYSGSREFKWNKTVEPGNYRAVITDSRDRHLEVELAVWTESHSTGPSVPKRVFDVPWDWSD